MKHPDRPYQIEFNDFAFVVVGSGFLGSVVAERIASQLDQKVLVIERRNHVGGNSFSEVDTDTGIEFHKYGTHVFHTSNERVWNYIRQFTEFNSYRHQVLSSYKNRIYQLPINLETINSFYQVNLRPFEVDEFMASKRIPIENPANLEEKAISLIGKDLYEAFVRGYTMKQWDMEPKQLPASIFSRIPFRKNYDENYYFDKWQGIPVDGYGALFNRLLLNKKISLLLNLDYFEIRQNLNPGAIIVYTGPIDRYFNFMHGKLGWRRSQFTKEIVPVEDYQGNAVINFPEAEIPFTRVHEPRHLHPERNYTKERTLIFKEYSLADDGSEPFYPILNEYNQKILTLYKTEASKLKNTIIAGRLGNYTYVDMHQSIDLALNIFENRILSQIQS